MARTLFFVSLLASLAAGAPQPFIVHETIESVPQGFVHAGTPSSTTELSLRIGLVQNNIVGLQEKLIEISTPSSATYGQWMSTSEIAGITKPSPQADAAVKDWLAANGLTAASTSVAGDWLTIKTTVGQANSLFNTEFQQFNHSDTGKTFILEVVHPTVTFPNPISGPPSVQAIGKRELTSLERRDISKRAIPAACAHITVPVCIQAIYGVPATNAASGDVKLGVSGFIGQFAQTADLESFLTEFRSDIPSSTTFDLQTLDGGSNPQGAQNAGFEANLDIQYTVGVATGVPVTFISYSTDESFVSRAMANSLCNAFASLGAAGMSVLFASGDGGVAGSRPRSCNNFVFTFPSGCPFMTSVGATQGFSPEVAAGFSSPSYQSDAVNTYLDTAGLLEIGRFNTSGRAFPDVSAQGVNFVIVNGGDVGTVSGTSASSPVFASIIALINDRLVAAGKPVLGFLNPFLYSKGAAALNDIIIGSNPGCNTPGFPALIGWDPVTGLGTPNFAELLTAVGL
ncbi:family S53 protease [Sistotremastrum niveocremeum HHB9708]|uniref:Family S53 protease n=1 Tax=Sistotremastrum niveocremeum HHB9708 TaxID=1314777 RepID=A0A164W2L1_9AGAM|nr:family S53 protease [Sistotremastrum niveocremeum HHB9708]